MVYQAMRGWVPAMLVTEHGVPADVKPYNPPDLLTTIMQGTPRKWGLSESPIQRRLRQRRSERANRRTVKREPTERERAHPGNPNERAPIRNGDPTSRGRQ